ncbi:hypothetical protein [Halonatronum saccharophilum]|uniref:hypothetical protein n=1 Tax=Halonatronum saccharophilum TaxID=150060 RepID=UPI00047F7D73|nr:hypothetical protein [Halonatronum saccharophilum]
MKKNFLKAFLGSWLQILSFLLIVEMIDKTGMQVKSIIKTPIGAIFIFSIFIIFEMISTYERKFGLKDYPILKRISGLFMFKEREELNLSSTILLGSVIFIILYVLG